MLSKVLVKSTQRGFTVVELLITVGIISILTAAIVAVIRPLDYIKRSRDTRRISDLKVIQTALEQYYGSENSYPGSVPTDGSALVNPEGTVTFLNMTPKDPESPSKNYCYFQGACSGGSADSSKYTLCASLEMSSGTSCAACPTNNYCSTNPF